MHRAARQVGEALPGMEAELVLEQRRAPGIEERTHLGRGAAPPFRPARVLQVRGVRTAGEVHAREQRAQLGTLRVAGPLERGARQPRDQRRRLAIELPEILIAQIGERRRRRDAMAREVRHQIEIERQLGRRQPFVQRQHVTAFFGRHEIVGVLDARRDRREVDEPSDRVPGEPCVEILGGDGRVDGHEKGAARHLRAALQKTEKGRSVRKFKRDRRRRTI